MESLAFGLSAVALGAAGALYTYAGYPLLLAAAARRSARRDHARGSATETMRALRLLVPAYNEEDRIADKVRELLMASEGLDCEVVVVDDGSTDDTARVAASFAEHGVRVLRLPRNMGKNAALEYAMAHLSPHPPLVGSTDVDASFDGACLRALVCAASRPEVGVAAARVVYAGGEGAGRERRYFGYENLVRELESAVGACVSIGGQLEIHRREIWQPLPDDVATDMATALMARTAGLASIQVPEAVATTPAGGVMAREIGRKRRTMRRALAALRWQWSRLSWGDRWRVTSHKVCRYLLPLYQALVLAGTVALLPTWPRVWGTLLLVQLAIYGAAAVGARPSARGRLLRAMAYYQRTHLVGMVEVLRVMLGRRSPAAWSRAR